MKTITSRNQYLDDQIACIIDSLIFGHLQRKQYSKTLHALLSESPHLAKDATTVPNAPNQIILNVNGFLHDQNLEQIIEAFYTYGRFDVSPNLLELGKKLRELTNELSSELAFGCHSYANNAQRLYGRKLRARTQHTPTIANQMNFDYQFSNGKRTEYSEQGVSHSLNETAHNNDTELQYSQTMEHEGTRREDTSSHEIAHHSRRKAAQPLKQTQILVKQSNSVTQLVKMSNEVLRDKEADVDNSSFLIDPYFGAGNFNDILNSVVDDDTLYETLASVEREEAMADQNIRDSMNQTFALDIPMHDEVAHSSSDLSPHPDHSIAPSQLRHSLSIPLPPSSHNVPSMNRDMPPPRMDQYNEHSSIVNPIENRAYNSAAVPPPPSPPPQNPRSFSFEHHANITMPEAEKNPTREVRESGWTKNGAPPSQSKTSLPPPSHTSHALPPSSSNTLGMAPKLSSLGRIPKKGQSSGTPGIAPSHSASPRDSYLISESSKCLEGFRISKGKTAPVNGKDGRKDSADSQDTLRAESVGESDCTMTENEDNDQPVRKEPIKREKKPSWDDLFDDGPSTVEESNKEREKQKDYQENKRRLEMKELEKKREREKRRKEKEKKEDDRRDRTRDDKNRYEKRSVEDGRREEKDDREKEKEDRQRKRREQEEQKKIIDEQKRQMESEERARQKKKEEEERKRELKEREKELKKVEDEKIRKEREIKAKEERRNELERRRRREAQQKKNLEPCMLGDSPLDKIAAEMDGKELRKENEVETTPPASSRVMEISSGLERNRPSAIIGSLHSSKSGIYLDKAQKVRTDTTTRQPQPFDGRRRIEMAPKKRPPPPSKSGEDSEDDDDSEKSPVQKKGKLEDTKIDHILNKLYR